MYYVNLTFGACIKKYRKAEEKKNRTYKPNSNNLSQYFGTTGRDISIVRICEQYLLCVCVVRACRAFNSRAYFKMELNTIKVLIQSVFPFTHTQ